MGSRPPLQSSITGLCSLPRRVLLFLTRIRPPSGRAALLWRRSCWSGERRLEQRLEPSSSANLSALLIQGGAAAHIQGDL